MTVIRDGKEQFAGMDLLRVIASLMIVLFHAHSIALKHVTANAEIFFEAPRWWYSCIDLFFTMSGFLMIHMSRNLYGSWRGVKIFAARRASRTPPLYWIYTLMIAGLFLALPNLSSEGPVTWQKFLASVFFFPMQEKPVIAIGWTLNYEIFFYCIIGLSLFFPYAKGWKFSALILVTLVAIGRILDLRTNPWATWTDPLMLDFVIGILVAVIYYRGAALSSAASWGLVLVGVLAILAYRTPADFDVMRALTMGVGMGCIVAAVTWRKVPISFPRAGRYISLLSNQTYTMYLCHILVLKTVELVYYRIFGGWWAHIAYILFGTVVTIIASKVLYELLERHVTEHLRQRVKRMNFK